MMKAILFLAIQLMALVCQAQFSHPGMLHNSADLELVRQKVNNGEEPWKSAYADLQNSDMASLNWVAKPVDNVVVGYYSLPNIGGTAFWNDGDAAYSLTLRWYISQDKAYAEKAIEILNAWSSTMDSITHDNRKWHLGTGGITFLNAAEIIRHTYKGWKKKDQQAFENLVLNFWFPVLEPFQPDFNGNWHIR